MFKFIFMHMYKYSVHVLLHVDIFKYFFKYYSRKAEKFGIANLDSFGMPRNLMPIPTEVRKYGSKKFPRSSVPTESVGLF